MLLKTSSKFQKRKHFTAHVQKTIVLGGLIQSVNKMDLMSALQFLRLKDIPPGEFSFMYSYCHLICVGKSLKPTRTMSGHVRFLLAVAN